MTEMDNLTGTVVKIKTTLQLKSEISMLIGLIF